MKEYNTYIFDLDGTLLDSITDLWKSCNYALRQAGLPEHTKEDVTQFVGNGVRKLIERAVPNGDKHEKFEEVLNTFKAHYVHHNLDTTCPYEGVMELLKELKRRKKNIAIVSNKFNKATKELSNHFFGDLIDVAIGESEGVRKKPAPDTIYEVLDFMRTTKDEAVYIGDSDVDIMTAQNSGLECISVSWGFRSEAFLKEHGATHIVHSPQEILPSVS